MEKSVACRLQPQETRAEPGREARGVVRSATPAPRCARVSDPAPRSARVSDPAHRRSARVSDPAHLVTAGLPPALCEGLRPRTLGDRRSPAARHCARVSDPAHLVTAGLPPARCARDSDPATWCPLVSRQRRAHATVLATSLRLLAKPQQIVFLESRDRHVFEQLEAGRFDLALKHFFSTADVTENEVT